MGSVRGDLALGLLLVGVSGLASGSAAYAGPAQVELAGSIASASPLPASCDPDQVAYPDSEVEPSLAVNPNDPDNLVAVWQQNRFANGAGAVSDVAGVSTDGGRSWKTVLVPGLSRCTGGSYARATDPWVSFGGDGTAYFATIPHEVGFMSNAVAVSRSVDGGRSFTAPVFATAEGDVYNDREALTAHPTKPGRAYVIWSKRIPYPESAANTLNLSETSDGGLTWSAPRVILAAAPFMSPQDNEIVVLPDGTLVNVFQLYNDSDDVTPEGAEVPNQIVAIRSQDDGESWSLPVRIGEASARAPADPDGRPSLNAILIPSADVAAEGTVYVAWNDITTGRAPRILFAKSADGGRTWSAPGVVKTLTAQGFVPTLAVSREAIGVTYYDLRNDTPGDNELTTDVWFSHSHDGGRTWHEDHLAGPFDHRSAPTKGENPFLADYNGLAALPDGNFVSATGVAKPLAKLGRSDIFFARLRITGSTEQPPRACLARRSPIGQRNIGRVRLGYTRRRLLGLPVKPVGRTRRSFRYCVKRSKGRVTAVFSRRGGVVLVITTARSHGNRGVRPGRRVALRAAYPRRRALGGGVYRAGPRSRRLVGVRQARVRFLAVATPRLLRKPRALRRHLQLTGL